MRALHVWALFTTLELSYGCAFYDVGAPFMAPGLTQIVLLIAVTHILFHKTQAVSNTLRCIFGVV